MKQIQRKEQRTRFRCKAGDEGGGWRLRHRKQLCAEKGLQWPPQGSRINLRMPLHLGSMLQTGL
ncbi:hypothetical protein KTH_56290 [Thermosporothrix hazakensis]|nr:hypothetical protein KTH_56290 [Thermosporothrix hazakensis]